MPRYIEALLLVAISTAVGILVSAHWGTAAVDLVYLPAVLAAAILAGRGPAVAAAIGSALAYNYFFTAPYHTFRVHSPSDIVTVGILFVVALVTSHLAGSIQAQAQLAEAHAARNSTIAGFARQLLSCTCEQDIAAAGVKTLAGLFDCNAVLLGGQSELYLVAAAPSAFTLTPSDIAAAAAVMATGEPAGRGYTRVTSVEWQFHPVQSEKATLAVIGLARDDGFAPVGPDRLLLLQSLVDQIALALARTRLENQAREYSALRERDRLRSALISSIGEDLKPRLQTIGDAVARLRRGGTESKEALSALATETSMLDRYVTNLLELGPATDEQPIEISGIKIDLFNRQVSKDGARVHLTPKEFAVLAELARYPGRVLTHAHLLRTAWGPAQERQTEYIRVAVRALRQKLERDPTRPQIIINEPAVGYRLVA
jgi:two-component system sensor histidine kinase KdpD